MSDTVREFLSRLDTEVEALRPRLATDTLGLGFLTAIREFDRHCFSRAHPGASGEERENFFLMRLSLPRLVRETFLAVPHFEVPVVTFRADAGLTRAVLDVVARFGLVEHGRRLARATMAGECRLERVDDSLFEFRLPATLYDYEALESDVRNHYLDQTRTRRDEVIHELLGKTGVMERISELLAENVYVFQDHFIGYHAHPVLDDYFFGLAYAEVQYTSAYDTFHHRLTFGGLQYQHYILGLACCLFLSMKHVRFCATLIRRHPAIELPNILTISADKTALLGTLQDVINHYGADFEWFSPVSAEQVTQLYRVLSIRRDNSDLLERGIASLPCLIEFSDSAVVHCVAGTQLDPGEFLLESLRYNFPGEYDRHQQTREGSMQKAMRRVLGDAFTSLKFCDNIRIKREGEVVTDIDFVAYEAASRTVILFQLKHQDHYGSDFRRRSNRARRLTAETRSWLSKVTTWLRSAAEDEVLSALQLAKGTQLDHIHTVAVAKNFAHFLAPLATDDNFAYASWVQFYDALTRLRAKDGASRTLSGLFQVLREYMSHRKVRPERVEGISLFSLHTVKFRVVQEDAAPAAK